MRREMKNLAVEFGTKLRQKRKELGISQDKLALMADIDRSYVGRVERGEVNVTLEKAYQLAGILECDVREILP
jgi:transcriptional regulator with XRE-family HTH domain